MNGAHAHSPAHELPGPKPPGENWPAEAKRSEGWSRRRWLTLIALLFAAQVGFIFALGERHFAPPRAVVNVPQLTLADSSSELLALNDPTLFVLPHANDFASAVWRKTPVAPQPSFRWTEPSGELPLAAENLGAVFDRFMQTNQFVQSASDFKPPAKLSEPVLPLPPFFADSSTLQIEGDLAQRKSLASEDLPSWPGADVIAPSKVQVLVDATGEVVSWVLLPPDNRAGAAAQYDPADRRALELARATRFAPSSGLTVGQMIFNWRTVPPTATNSPANP
jgi:hypothetical protein